MEKKCVGLESIEVLKMLGGEGKNRIMKLDINGEEECVMVSEVERDGLKD